MSNINNIKSFDSFDLNEDDANIDSRSELKNKVLINSSNVLWKQQFGLRSRNIYLIRNMA